MKYKASTIEPMLEYVLDFLTRKILRLIYRSLKAGRSKRIDSRSFSNCFDSSMYGYDQQMGLGIAWSKEELAIRARNYVITIIEFRRRLVGVYRRAPVKPIGSTASVDSGNKVTLKKIL